MSENFLNVDDINDVLPVIKKVRCAGKMVDPRRRLIYNKDKCGQVYLRIVDKEDRATDLDKRATRTKCPTCGSEEYEDLVKFNIGSDGFRVVIKKNKEW